MRKVKRWRYYCDFCKKSGGSGGHMAEHEKHCTMNPDRVCGMCRLYGFDQPDLKGLIALLPNIEDYTKVFDEYDVCDYGEIVEITEKVMSKLREKTQNCPACILAALRQARIPIYMVDSFNFTEECKAWWSEFNKEQVRQDAYGDYY